MVGNTMGAAVMNQLGSKSPNLQSPNAGGMQMCAIVNSMPMSISNNGTQMNSMSGKEKNHLHNLLYYIWSS